MRPDEVPGPTEARTGAAAVVPAPASCAPAAVTCAALSATPETNDPEGRTPASGPAASLADGVDGPENT